MAWFSFHGGHSGSFCGHAEGTLEEILEAAVAGGFTCYGLSEHAPKARECDLAPDEAGLSLADSQRRFREYARQALALRDRFADRIEVLVGFETEAVPPGRWASFARTVRSWAAFDYVVGSVHHVGEWPLDVSGAEFERAVAAVGSRAALERAYFEELACVVTELEPDVVGHFDLVRIGRSAQGEEATLERAVWPCVEHALEAIRDAGSLLEVNAAPVRKKLGPVHPLPEILSRARRMGIPVTLGDDSHAPDHVGLGLDACLQAVADAGYQEIHQLLRRDGAVVAEAVPFDEVHPARR